MLDFVLFMKEHRDDAKEILKNPKKLPIGQMEVIWNEATQYSLIEEYKNKNAAEKKSDL